MSARAAMRSFATAAFVEAAFGAAVATLALPPIGAWPFGPIGLALWYHALTRSSRKGAVAASAIAGGVYIAVGAAFIASLTLVGYVALTAVEAGIFALIGLATHRGQACGCSFVGAITLAEWLRGVWPLGGAPLGAISIGQVDGPLAETARVIGPLGIVAMTATVAVLVTDGTRFMVDRNRAQSIALGLGVLVLVGITLGSDFAPSGGASVNELKVAAVQGGGPRGIRQLDVSATDAFVRTYNESQSLRGPSIVLWPEDTVPLASTIDGETTTTFVSGLARYLGTTVVAGATEPVGHDRFLNEVLEWSALGKVTGRVEKVHRVPFGEYVPFRTILSHFIDLSDVPRDAIAGRGPEVLDIARARAGVVISYESFLATASRAAVRNGGEFLLVPTNTASYNGSQLPAEELAATRLDAIEVGRSALLAATVGYSAVIDSDGTIERLGPLHRAAVVRGTVALRTGSTIYVELGDSPVIFGSFLTIAVGNLARRRRRAVG